VLALDCANHVFELDVSRPEVKGWTRPRYPTESYFEHHTLFLVNGQWFFYHTKSEETLFIKGTYPPGASPNYAHFRTREQARDWFLAAGLELPDELEDLRPAKEPTPDLTPATRSTGAKAQPTKRKSGPKGPRTDPLEDKRIFDAWKTGRYKDYKDLARELHLERRDVKLAIDRHEKRKVKE
jgi:hypothetical protein